MQIVPDSDELIVEALVPPQDIDVVRIGQNAKVRLTAYNIRKTPPVEGR
ncbi:membrane-fusion protein [Vibrio variabilis]|uniref:Membrane-fusion protein n=1 Tax=Vibrio variabilis TaxID=990271 RepID=A0ABQ0JLP5_9VIBR|nr:membrane-fusion protein [Vibrio variabilis]